MKNQQLFSLSRQASTRGLVAGAVLALGAVLAVTGNGYAQSVDAAADQPAWFSEAQVTRGQQLYEARCSTCHASEIVDGYGQWDDSAQSLVDFILSMGMPADNPGGLPPQQYIDIAAYIMHSGGGLDYGEEVLVGSENVNLAKR